MENILERLTAWAKSQDTLLAMYFYGSYAKGQQTPESDLDIALLYEPGSEPPARNVWEIQLTLSKLVNMDVDVVIFNGASDVLRHQVLKYGRRFYTSDVTKTANYECYALSRYNDFVFTRKPLVDRLLKRAHG